MTLRLQKSTSGGILCIFGIWTVVPIIWMCKNQTSVSHSFTESEIVSLDAGLCMDGYLLMIFGTLWLKYCDQPQTYQHPGNWCDSAFQNQDPECQKKTKDWASEWFGLCAHKRTVLSKWVSVAHFEDDEAVIKLIIKGRHPQGCSWWVVWQNQFGTQDPNQICWHQKPPRRHSDQRKFLKIWMESPSSFVQHREFLDVFLWPLQWFSSWRSG